MNIDKICIFQIKEIIIIYQVLDGYRLIGSSCECQRVSVREHFFFQRIYIVI